MPSEDYQNFQHKKSHNLSLVNDRDSISLLPINLDVLLKNRFAKS